MQRVSSLAATAVLVASAAASANPAGGTVTAGGVTIASPTPTSTLVTQTTPTAIVNWDSFYVNDDESVTFVQPGVTSAILNRVSGADITSIYGQIHANGQVFLISPGGLYLAPTSRIDVGALVASSLDISDADFLAGRYHFVKPAGRPNAQVINFGVVSALPGGYIALLGDFTGNEGSIEAPLGTIAMGAGSDVLMSLGASGLVDLQISADAVQDPVLLDRLGVENGGSLLADGGRILVDSRIARGLAFNAVNLKGAVHATAIQGQGGEVILRAEGGDAFIGFVDVQAATFDASSHDANLVIESAGIAADDIRLAALGDGAGMALSNFGMTVGHRLDVHSDFEIDLNNAGISAPADSGLLPTLTFTAGRNFSIANVDISGGDITLRAGYPDVGNLELLDYVGIHGRNVVLDSNFSINDNVFTSKAYSTYIDADSLVVHAGFGLALPYTAIHVGSGVADYAHDTALVDALAQVRPDLAPPSRAPNAIFDAPLFIDLGQVQVDGGYLYVHADGLRLFGGIYGPSNLLLQFDPADPALNIGIENQYFFRTIAFQAHERADSPYGQIANLQPGATFAVGGGAYSGGLAIGEFLPPDFSAEDYNFAFMTSGHIAGADTIATHGSVLTLRGTPVNVLPPDNYTILDVIFQTASLQSLAYAFAEGFEASVYNGGAEGTFSYQYQSRKLEQSAEEQGIHYANHRAEYGASTSFVPASLVCSK